MILLSALLQFAGLALIAATMRAAPAPIKRRITTAGGTPTTASTTLVAVVGWALLILSAAIMLASAPFGLALLDWLGLACVAAILVLLLWTAVALASRRR